MYVCVYGELSSDCNGDLAGGAYEDQCGTCDADPTNEYNTSVVLIPER